MSIHPEDLANYAADTHRDLGRIAAALERIAEAFEASVQGESYVNVKQVGAWITREDRE